MSGPFRTDSFGQGDQPQQQQQQPRQTSTSSQQQSPTISLNQDEKKVFGQLFKQGDPEGLGIVTGEVARTLFERSGLPPSVLGEIWQLVDSDNQGFLDQLGFSLALRIIGHVQNGQRPSARLGEIGKFFFFFFFVYGGDCGIVTNPYLFLGGPLPVFDGQPRQQHQQEGAPTSPHGMAPSPASATRIPPLSANDRARFVGLFDKSAPNGMLDGDQARDIFLKARLPNETLGQIWNLADTQGRGQLNQAEFVIAMHLIQCVLSGALKNIPQDLPPGLYEAAAGRPPSRTSSAGSARGNIPRQYSGNNAPRAEPSWTISLQEKARFDGIFSNLDKHKSGAIGADEIVPFLTTSKLSEEVLAQIWDLSDIHNTGQFTKQEFSIAMYLVQQKLSGRELPTTLPQTLLNSSQADPASGSRQSSVSSNAAAAAAGSGGMPNPIFMPGSPAPQQQQQQQQQQAPPPQQPAQKQPQEPNSSINDLSSLNDLFSSPAPTPGNTSSPNPNQQQQQQQQQQRGEVRPFVPTSNFGQSLAHKNDNEARSSPVQQQGTGSGVVSPQQTQGSLPTTSASLDLAGQKSAENAYNTLDPNAQMPKQPQPQSQQQTGSRDLLTETDTDASKQVSSNSTEFANLSNQIGSLTTQTMNLTDKREKAEGELTRTQGVKGDIETRLASLRANYDAEVKKVKEVEQQLEASRKDTQKVENEYGVLQASYDAVQSQYNQIANQLALDQQENANLKEKIKATNDQIANLKEEIERAKKDSKQQSGFVSINSKQLAVSEDEKANLESELRELKQGGSTLAAGSEEAANTNSIRDISNQPEQETNSAPLSTSSTASDNGSFSQPPPRETTPSLGNPFFSGGFDGSSASSSNNNNNNAQQRGFEDSFNQMEIASPSTAEPARSSTHNTVDTPNSSPPNSDFQIYNQDGGQQPPTFTLPIARPESASSSVQNNPPQSVRGDLDVSRPDSPEYTSEPVSGIVPPDDLDMSGMQQQQREATGGEETATIPAPSESNDPLRQTSLATLTPPQMPESSSDASKEPVGRSNTEQGSSESFEIVNADEGDQKREEWNEKHPPEQASTAFTSSAIPGAFPSESELPSAAVPSQSREINNNQEDAVPQRRFNEEFPPIEEFDQPDDSSSDEEGEETADGNFPTTSSEGANNKDGGDDDFLTPTSTGDPKARTASVGGGDNLASETTSTEGNVFTSATSTPAKEEHDEFRDAASSNIPPSNETPKASASADDPFANAFSGLSEAKEENEEESTAGGPSRGGDTSFGESFNFSNRGFDDFNSTFDNAFADFSGNKPVQAQNPNTAAPSTAPTNDEWEELFSGFSRNPPPSAMTQSDINDAFSVKQEGSSREPPPKQSLTPHSEAVEHLSNMGFDRQSALDALEKKNYDLAEASNYLLDKS